MSHPLPDLPFRGGIALRRLALTVAIASSCTSVAHADAVTDWNAIAGEAITAAALGTPPANRVMAIAHTAAFEAANAISKRYPAAPSTAALPAAPPGASVDASIAAAHRSVLTKLVPSQQQAVDNAYIAALAKIDHETERRGGIAIGEAAAAAVLAARADDGAVGAEAIDRRPRPARTCPPRCRWCRIGRAASRG